MIEQYSYTGERVATEVLDKSGDAGNAQITRAMLLVWINNGIRSISAQHGFLEGAASTNLLAGIGTYDMATLFAAQRVQSYAAITVSGRPLKLITFGEYTALLAANERTDDTGTPQVGMVRGTMLTVWPVPDTTVAAGLTLYYSALPEDLTDLADTLTLPDRFYNALVDYVTAQALELDENFEAAQVKMAQHEAGVRREFEREHISPTDFYPTITWDPEDDDRAMPGPSPRMTFTTGGGYGSGGYGE